MKNITLLIAILIFSLSSYSQHKLEIGLYGAKNINISPFHPNGFSLGFTTKYNIKENTETVFFNGLLIYTFGGDPDYTIIGPNKIEFAVDYTPKTAAEKIAGAIDDLILITYVRDN